MLNGWTIERKARQAEMIRAWKPWVQSTGPRTDEGKAAASRNAFKGGERQMIRTFRKLLRDQDEARMELFIEALERRRSGKPAAGPPGGACRETPNAAPQRLDRLRVT